jgi:type IV pilus assembly protein PilO
MAFQLSDLNELDFENVGSWPAAVKYVSYLIVFGLVVGLFYYADTGDQYTRLAASEEKEKTLKKTYETKYRKSANLEAYKIQMQEMQLSFSHLLQQLPKGKEIPDLIDDISFSESASGLDIRATRLLDEKKVDFYSEKPFRLEISGKFHSLGGFISRVASLPRIVTLHDFNIQLVNNRQNTPAKLGEDPVLKMDITAKTYRYDQEEEE